MLAWLTDPFGSPIVVRALVEVLILAVACGPLGVWVLLYRDAYAAESISHGMLPGLVVAALIGAPLVLGALGGVLVAAAGIALVAADRRLSARRRRRGLRLGAARAGRDARAVGRTRRRGCRSCSSATCSASTPATSRWRARSRAASWWRWRPGTGGSRSSGSTAARRQRSARRPRAGSSRSWRFSR